MLITDKKLKKLAQFLADNDIIIIKTAPIKSEYINKLCVSIHDEMGQYIDYEFAEDITSDKILDRDFKYLKPNN